MTKTIDIEMSHDRPRVFVRRPTDGGTPALPPPSESDASAPMNDPGTGRWAKGNRAYRRRALKSKARGISTLNPERCESWLSPHVRAGAGHGIELLSRFPDPALLALVGATADAYVVFRGLLSQGAAGDPKALDDARGWLREYRACIRELSALAGFALESKTEDMAAMQARILGGAK